LACFSKCVDNLSGAEQDAGIERPHHAFASSSKAPLSQALQRESATAVAERFGLGRRRQAFQARPGRTEIFGRRGANSAHDAQGTA